MIRISMHHHLYQRRTRQIRKGAAEGGASGVFADILPADGGAASGLLERMKEGGATASGLLKEGGAGLERMFSRGMKWLDEG